MKILIIKKEDGALLSKYDADAPNQGSYGGPWGDVDHCAHMETPEGMDHECLSISIVDGEIVIEADEAAETAKAAAALASSWASMRAERDLRLANCDFTQLSDAPLSVEVKAEYATYRQALRDLPENTEDPNDITWPEEP